MNPVRAAGRTVRMRLGLTLLVAACLVVGAPRAASSPSGTPTEAQNLLVRLINMERTARGAPPLVLDADLCEAARRHAEDMIASGYFGHRSPTLGTLASRLGRLGIPFRKAGENLAGHTSVAGAHKMLMDSGVHRGNILDPEFNRLGVAVVTGGPYGAMIVEVFLCGQAGSPLLAGTGR
ncbi:MAG: CAP domain-containing protein [Firmicutes bacterium]|jgi:uncharacterized protein YkwD|nr:CAP domain-containing protein [Bacillota bacterium]